MLRPVRGAATTIRTGQQSIVMGKLKEKSVPKDGKAAATLGDDWEEDARLRAMRTSSQTVALALGDGEAAMGVETRW